MQTSTVFHEDVFYAYFRPFRHPSAHFNIWGGHGLETFGADLQLAFDYDENHVWTVVDNDESRSQWIVPGFQRINRICYLLTEIGHNNAPIEFRVKNAPSSLTKTGLTRRISTLKKLLARNLEIESKDFR